MARRLFDGDPLFELTAAARRCAEPAVPVRCYHLLQPTERSAAVRWEDGYWRGSRPTRPKTANLYSESVTDYVVRVPDPKVQRALNAAFDQEGKVTRALVELGGVAGRDVLVIGAEAGLHEPLLQSAGARVTSLDPREMAVRPARSTDGVVALRTAVVPETDTAEAELRDATRILRPGGRLLVFHDYGRDDASALLADEAGHRRLVDWSRRDGWFLTRGFKVRVLHTWWTFDSLEEAAGVLAAAFGPRGESVAAALRRPRLSHKVAAYHLTMGNSQ